MSIPPNEPFFRGFNGLLALVANVGGGGDGGSVDVNDIIGLVPYIENVINTSPNVRESVQDIIGDTILGSTDIVVDYDDSANTVTIEYLPAQYQYNFNDNTTLNVVVGNAVAERAVIFDYTLETLAGVYQVGNVQIIHNGTLADLRHEYVGVPNEIKKVSYSASLNVDDIRFSIVASGVGSNLKLRITNRSSIAKTI